MSEKMTINYRFLARIVIEAETPLSVKSGEKDIYTDAVVTKDMNGLPYIPGSSLAGVIRHAWCNLKKDENEFFGFQGSGDNGKGSRIIFSEARILNSEGVVMDGWHPDGYSDELLKYYGDLPVRQHVRINHLGVAADTGKFDEEVVYVGTRFCFEMEMLGNKCEEEEFKTLMGILYSSTFRIGSGTRKGFGKLKPLSIHYLGMDINSPQYLTKSSNLEESKSWYRDNNAVKLSDSSGGSQWKKYELELIPNDFFLFGSGFGDDEADITPVKERKVSWENGEENMRGKMVNCSYLLPASSIKGAIAHRVAFHYNKLNKVFAENLKDPETHIGKNNMAVRLLFGFEGSFNESKLQGNVILSDLFINSTQGEEKILNHVAIDRFTGGTINGALFSEKVVYGKKQTLRLEILIDEENMKRQIDDEEDNVCDKVIEALENTLDDICAGLLPLGGGVNRGNGRFSGKIKKAKEE